MLSPFVFLGFYTVDYIYSCTYTLLQSVTVRIQFSLRFWPHSHSEPLSLSFLFDLRTSAQPPNPFSFLEPDSHPLRHVTHPRPPLFVCFGHGQRCASASTPRSDALSARRYTGPCVWALGMKGYKGKINCVFQI